MTTVSPDSPVGAAGGAVAAIELRGVRSGYGRVEALHGVDLAVPAGSVFAVLGANGVGKTTILRTISGLLAPWAGRVLMLGHDVTGAPAPALARAGVRLVPEGRGVFARLTVDEHLRMSTQLGVPLSELEHRVYGRFPQLGERRHQVVGTMSGGEQQMLGLARALATEPAILLVDELSMGLAPVIVADLYDDLVRIAREEALTVVLVEQFARTVLAFADRAAVVSGGVVAGVGRPDDVAALLEATYLGHTEFPTTDRPS